MAISAVYAMTGLGVARPRIGLLSIGEEETKGNELTREAHQLIKASALEFIGNVEARSIFSGDADVIVAGGSEATVSPLGVGGFASMRALSTRNDDPATASRPWDRDRDGFEPADDEHDQPDRPQSPIVRVAGREQPAQRGFRHRGFCIFSQGASSAACMQRDAAQDQSPGESGEAFFTER